MRRKNLQPLYEKNLEAFETVLKLIDAVLEDSSPLIALAEDPSSQIEQLRHAKVTLSILAHSLRRASEGRLSS